MSHFRRNVDNNEGKYGGDSMPRDSVGYGGVPYDPKWPGGKKVALSLVLNYEEGAENCLLHNDTAAEGLLTEIVGCPAYQNQRHVNVESMYDFGSRSGFWRLHRLLNSHVRDKVTVFACGMALERNKEAASAMQRSGWEIASHGYRWIDIQNTDERTEKEQLLKTVQVHRDLFGQAPLGIYQGKPNQHSRRRIYDVERSHPDVNFIYSNDSYADELPYWISDEERKIAGKPHLIIPYSLSENDMRFVAANAYPSGREFANYLIDHLDYLIREATSGQTKGAMMSVGLHCRIVGRAGRAKGLEDFLKYVNSVQEHVWVCKREDIAKHWYENHWKEDFGPKITIPIADARAGH